MELEEIKELLETTKLPVAYRAFRSETALPFIVYLETGSNNFFADSKTYLPVKRITVELYTKFRDEDAETLVETALEPFCYQKGVEWIDSEQCYEILYEFEV